jgi:predicted ThiF/HesA family dinucleotide-utilizing enzyme
MFSRHALTAAVAICALVPALAQDSVPGSSGSQLRATGAYPIRQDTSQWLGSNLIGAKVISASNESIGRLANLVVNDDGAVEAAVISIGGVFGMGAKEVAVTYKSLNFVRNRNSDGIDHIVLAATKNDLRQAADFKTLREQKAERVAHRTPDVPVTAVKMTTPPP